MDFDMELLITLVENRPVLWDKTRDCYKNRLSSHAAWKEICMAINDDFETLSDKEKNEFGKDIIKKWNNARDNRMKCHKKIKECKSGSAMKNIRKYKFYDQMLFLIKIINRRETESNITPRIAENIAKSLNEQTVSQTNNEQTDSQTNVLSAQNSITTSVANTKIIKKRKTDSSEVDRKMLNLINTVENEDSSKSMCFFKGIAPIVDKYNDDDYVEFQFEVMKLMRNFTLRKEASLQQQNYNTHRGYTTAAASTYVPTTSRTRYEQSTQLEDNDSQSSIYTEMNSLMNMSDYDFDFSKSP